MKPQRGELWHAFFPALGATAGHARSSTIVAVIQSDKRRYGRTTLCVPLTTNRERERPYGVLLEPGAANNLPHESVAMPWLALAVDTGSFRERLGRMQQVDLDRIVETLRLLIEE